MGVVENLPYTNFHELNLEWIVKKLKQLETEVYEAVPEKIQAPESGDVASLVANAFSVYRIGRLITGSLTALANGENILTGLSILTGMPKPMHLMVLPAVVISRTLATAAAIDVQLNVNGDIIIGEAYGTTIAENDTIVVSLSYFENTEEE